MNTAILSASGGSAGIGFAIPSDTSAAPPTFRSTRVPPPHRALSCRRSPPARPPLPQHVGRRRPHHRGRSGPCRPPPSTLPLVLKHHRERSGPLPAPAPPCAPRRARAAPAPGPRAATRPARDDEPDALDPGAGRLRSPLCAGPAAGDRHHLPRVAADLQGVRRARSPPPPLPTVAPTRVPTVHSLPPSCAVPAPRSAPRAEAGPRSTPANGPARCASDARCPRDRSARGRCRRAGARRAAWLTGGARWDQADRSQL